MEFKRRHHLDALRDDDRLQSDLAEIYRHTRAALINLRDMGNVVSRLETYVQHGTAVSHQPSGVSALELKPNIFGVGINSNYIWDRWGMPAIKRWLRR